VVTVRHRDRDLDSANVQRVEKAKVSSPPRIYCDFNGGIEVNVYALTCVGTKRDLELLGLKLEPGMRVVLYDYDAFDSGMPAWIVADATVVELPRWGLVAGADADSFRWEPRREPG
jgi:hypothetical protein